MAELPLSAQIQALLFASATSLSPSALARLTNHKPAEVSKALNELINLPQQGIVVAEDNGKYSLVTHPQAATVVSRLLDEPIKRDLSPAAIETLGLIAYRGPLTKHQIDHQRGVSSESIIRSLLARDLITEHDRTNEPGRPIRYRTTSTFLAYFGLTSHKELPPVDAETEVAHAS